jgi:hypothetical protein
MSATASSEAVSVSMRKVRATMARIAKEGSGCAGNPGSLYPYPSRSIIGENI